MESTPGNTHSVTFFPPGNVFFGSMISTMHPLTTNTAAVLRGSAEAGQTLVDPSCICRAEQDCQDGRSGRPATGMGSPEPRERASIKCEPYQAESGRVISTGTTHWSYCSGVT